MLGSGLVDTVKVGAHGRGFASPILRTSPGIISGGVYREGYRLVGIIGGAEVLQWQLAAHAERALRRTLATIAPVAIT